MRAPLFDAARRVEKMIGREDELRDIAKALYTPGDECRIVLIKGRGGIGKSRLLDEIFLRAKQIEDARHIKKQWPELLDDLGKREYLPGTVSEIIDFDDIRLGVRSNLLKRLRDALLHSAESVDFADYDVAAARHQRAVARSADYASIKHETEVAEQAFWDDYANFAKNERIVLLLDTAERLVHRSSEWLEEHGLDNYTPIQDILKNTTPRWLFEQFEEGRFKNTTLVIAGRHASNEGGPFFKKLEHVIQEHSGPYKIIDIELDEFTLGESKEYFLHLEEEWKERIPANAKPFETHQNVIAETMQGIASDDERLEVLHIYTNGLPVLLSLYADLIHDADDIPNLLRVDVEKARADRNAGKGKLQEARAEIEQSFISILFRPGLRAEILQALARCPTGLNAEQLHYLLNCPEDVLLSEWLSNTEEHIYRERLSKIEDELRFLERLSIVKVRPDGRLGLQDEIYRIYDARMGEEEYKKEFESNVRKEQYPKLQRWAEYQTRVFQEERRKYQVEDERELKIVSPSMALTPRFRYVDDAEEEKHRKIEQKIHAWELERLHYALLADPAAGMNDAYTDIAESMWRSNNIEADIIVQLEAWRILKNPLTIQFTDLDVKYEQERIIRYASQEAVSRWLKRFVLRGNYQEILDFTELVEKKVDQITNQRERESWQHTLSRGERAIWAGYARTMLGENVEHAIENMRKYLKRMEKLASTTQNEVAVVVNGREEYGFLPGKNGHLHPALPRLHRVLAIGYNLLGYSYVVIGDYGKGVHNYGKALAYMRKTEFRAQQAATRNNLGRALASLGREERGYRICADALNLRRDLGGDVPIAYSLNTLALINNGMQRSERAWYQAAQAAAYFRRAQNSRGLGLALIQLSMALRRLATQNEPGIVLRERPEQLYGTALEAVSEAIDIFDDENEPLRLVEAYIEAGSVIRDQIHLLDMKNDISRIRRLATDAAIQFQRAIDEAREHDFRHLELEARVDLAWVFIHTGELDKAKSELDSLKGSRLIDQDYLLRSKKSGEKGVVPSGVNASYFYHELGKIHRFYALIAMQKFENRVQEIERGMSNREERQRAVLNDKDAQALLEESADSFVRSLLYGQLFSPRSRALVLAYNEIYDHLKKFNASELDAFRVYQKEAQFKYPDVMSRSYDFSNLDQWIDDCFGPITEKELA